MVKASIWDTYINAHIIDVNDEQLVWSGPDAMPTLPAVPTHVITAYNPFEQRLSTQENERRNSSLLAQLEKLNTTIQSVIGTSPKRDWQEPSFAIHGLSRDHACGLAQDFAQRGIFELNDEEMLVIEVNTILVKKKRPRVL